MYKATKFVLTGALFLRDIGGIVEGVKIANGQEAEMIDHEDVQETCIDLVV